MYGKSLLKQLLEISNEGKGITIIKSFDDERNILYSTLLKKSFFIYNKLKAMGASRGTQIVIQCMELENFIYAFWACVMGGFVAVPVDINNNEYRKGMNESLFNKLDDPLLLCDTVDNSDIFDSVFAGKAIDLSIIDYSSINDASAADIECLPEAGDDIVYILFSSGSTGKSKGVTITSSNIIADISGIAERLEMTQNDVFLSWQPLTHCYGLIVFHVLPIFLGVNQYLIPTEVFIRQPLLWAQMANKYKITRLGTIPYALKHFIDVCQQTDRLFDWDLSKVKSIMIGAEQVTIELCKDFTELMKKYSLHENVMAPLYGLTETVVIVGLHSLLTPLKSHRIMRDNLEVGKKVNYLEGDTSNLGASFLEIGRPICNVTVKITDDDFNELPENMVGHICAKGDIVTNSYFKDEEATNSLLKDDGWLDTGDIGFIVDGKLVVAGRVKELVVIGGKKYSCIYMEDVINRKVNKEGFGQVVACSGLASQKNIEQTAIFVQCSADFNDHDFKQRFRKLDKDIRKVLFDVVGVSIDDVVPVEVIPKTYSGKTRRVNLMTRFMNGEIKVPENILAESNENSTPIMSELSKSELKVKAAVAEIVANVLQVKITDYEAAFKDYGIVSINIPSFIDEVNRTFKLELEPSAVFNYTNINQLAKYIYKTINQNYAKQGEIMEDKCKEILEDNKVAIIGMSCRFPGGANSIDEYWRILTEGRDGICDVPESRWKLEKYYDEDENNPGKMYCKKGGFLTVPIDQFDARFFNISPKEATALDPQQRLVLELTWEAFENANLKITDYNGSDTGVYLGMSTDEYAMAHLYSGDLSRIDAYSLTGMCKSTACGRISYTFGFEGPSVAVDTACSSSLTAMHFACTALKAGETKLAVVAGVNLIVTPATNVGFSKLKATSVDGHSKSFDESANGYGRSEGAGVLLLKKLSDAVRDGDAIWGVVCGTALNQDGRSNGLTAPNGISQARLIESALKISNLQPADINYVEMHGTGTKLGDPIEVNAVMDTYCQGRSKDKPLKIGSVKSNIGHLEAAAGIASAIKVMLSMKNGFIPGNLYFNKPNPFINWDKAPIEVVGKHTGWDNAEGIKRAGINGFGFGGSNAHVIIEEYPAENSREPKETKGIDYILKIAAKTEASLKKYIDQYGEFLEGVGEDHFLDVLYKSNRNKNDFEYRFAVTGKSKDSLVNNIKDYLAGNEPLGACCSIEENSSFKKERKVVFMFTGQGSQYAGMGRYLFESNFIFRESMLLCNKLFKPYILKSITDLIYGEMADNAVIDQTVHAQPLIFAIEYSLAKMWESFGVVPEIVMGHSIGEYAAAVISGAISLEDAVKLVSIRGRLMDAAPGSGSMGTVFASEEIVDALIGQYKDTVRIAAINARETCVISGQKDHVDIILKKAENQKIRTKSLKVSHGFHSALMNPILEDFNAIAQGISYNRPHIRFVSALYAKELEDDQCQVLDHNYWTRHIADRVDFYHAVTSIDSIEDYVLVEIGASQVLSTMCKLIFNGKAVAVGTLNPKKEDAAMISEAIIKLYSNGVDINWSGIDFNGILKNSDIHLPAYPYDRARYWVEPLYDRSGYAALEEEGGHQLLGRKLESPLFSDGVVFQSRFSATKPFFMSEHIIFDTAISPAAAHVSMLLSAANELKRPRSVVIKDIELRTPLAIIGEEEKNVQICISGNSVKDSAYSIVSRSAANAEGEKWVTHSQGMLSVKDEYYEADIEFDKEYLDSIPFDADTEEILYDSMQSTGFNLGEGFRRITKNFSDNGQGVYFVEPMKTIPNLDIYQLYPGVIDSLLQTMLCMHYKEQRKKGIKNSEKTIIPYFIGSVTYNYKASDKLWCYVSTNNKDDILYGEVTAFNENGEVIIAIKDFMAKFTTKDVLLKEAVNNPLKFYYHENWVKDGGTRPLSKHMNAQYIFISDGSERAYKIIGELKKQGKNVISVVRADVFETRNNESFSVNSADSESWKQLFQNIKIISEACFVYYNENPQNTDGGNVYNFDNLNLMGLYKLVQTLYNSEIQERSKIKILTNNVHNIDNSKNININDAALWGFAKVLSIEYPKIYDGIVDFSDQCSEDRIVSEITGGTPEEVSLPDHNGRFVRRLINHSEFKKSAQAGFKKIDIMPGAAYLITGGTGALGMVYAESLISKGAKNILLMSRKEPSDKVKAKIGELSAEGVRIKAVAADVTDSASVEAAISRIKDEFPEIRGVIHAAGTLADKLIKDLEWEDFERVLGAKVTGTVNIYNSLDKDDLDFFIMVSSITSILGNMGQSNYAAANYFMNSFALWMQNNNVPGFSVCWGPWHEGGMAAVENVEATNNLSNLGISKFSLKAGAALIEDFLEEPYDNVLIADIDWKKINENFSGSGKKEFLSKITASLKNEDGNNTEQESNKILAQLKGMPKSDRFGTLLAEMQKICGKIMGFDNNSLPDVDMSFREQGAESLMLFQIRNKINKLLNIELDISTLYNYSSLRLLAKYLMDTMLSFEDKEDIAQGEDKIDNENTDILLNELEMLIDR